MLEIFGSVDASYLVICLHDNHIKEMIVSFFQPTQTLSFICLIQVLMWAATYDLFKVLFYGNYINASTNVSDWSSESLLIKQTLLFCVTANSLQNIAIQHRLIHWIYREYCLDTFYWFVWMSRRNKIVN